MGLQARLWSNDAAAGVLVGREDAEVMDKVATYMQGYKEERPVVRSPRCTKLRRERSRVRPMQGASGERRVKV